MSFFGGPEAKVRIEKLEKDLIELEDLVRKNHSLVGHSNVIRECCARATRQIHSARRFMRAVDSEAPFYAWAWGYIAEANQAVNRGQSFVKKGNELVNSVTSFRQCCTAPS